MGWLNRNFQFYRNLKSYRDLQYIFKTLDFQVFTGAAFTGYATRDISFYLYNNNTNVYAYEFTYPSMVGYYGSKLKGYEDGTLKNIAVLLEIKMSDNRSQLTSIGLD